MLIMLQVSSIVFSILSAVGYINVTSLFRTKWALYCLIHPGEVRIEKVNSYPSQKELIAL